MYESKLWGRWVNAVTDIFGEALATSLKEFSKIRQYDLSQCRMCSLVDEWSSGMIARFRARILCASVESIEEETANQETLTLARQIGDGYCSMYLAAMLVDLENKYPELLKVPAGVFTGEYHAFLQWVSYKYGLPEESEGQNLNRVVSVIVDTYEATR